jgi:hypothetical protein
MRRVHTTFDLLEAHVITEMLREHGIAAWLFDADFVRQDWFKMIAYGGYRILVRDESVPQALSLLQDYRRGDLAVQSETRAQGPQCARNDGSDDPQPRRNVFLVMLLLSVTEIPILLSWHPSRINLFVASVVLVALGIFLPWLIIRYFKWRMRCENCAYRWREPQHQRYAQLAELVAAAERADNTAS